MLFNSLAFLVFFPVVVTAYFLLPYKYRPHFLLAASYYFYMAWVPSYILVIIFLTLLDYVAGLKIGSTAHPGKRKAYLLLSILGNLGLLGVFKYLPALGGGAYPLFVPIGISFHTFQSLGYIVDVYRGDRKPEKRLLFYALYVAYFPQLVAGPIERAKHLLPQFDQPKRFDYARVTSGLRLMAWGFFQKLVIADNLAPLVDAVFQHPKTHAPWVLLRASYFFAFQIYCDFAGYSDIAIGAARVMGHSLVVNFNSPYAARSLREFWHRWHVSLSSWFRDYVYIPLGGNRVPGWRWVFNILVVFLLSGIWHGARLSFAVWGLIHGVFLICAAATARWREALRHHLHLARIPRIHAFFQILVTFHFVVVGWIFFRAASLGEAVRMMSILWQGFLSLSSREGWLGVVHSVGPRGITRRELLVLGFIVLLELAQWWRRHGNAERQFLQFPIWMRWSCYVGLVLAILLLGNMGGHEFVYFNI